MLIYIKSNNNRKKKREMTSVDKLFVGYFHSLFPTAKSNKTEKRERKKVKVKKRKLVYGEREREVVQHNTTHAIQYISTTFDSPSISSISNERTHSTHTRECGPSSFHFIVHVVSDSSLVSSFLLSFSLSLSTVWFCMQRF
jgi:tRNA U34 5-carboxymethylaminomethyl modifying enzyme MnmG/GidA